jgi:hypothetical protein
MSFKQKMTADLLFGVQIVCTLIFGGSQFLRMLSTSQGVSVSWYGSWEVFLLLNLILAIRAHRNQASRVTFQIIMSYAAWVAMVTLDLGVMLVKNTGMWNGRDTVTTMCAVVGVATTLAVASCKRLAITDPMVKGYLAIFFKAVPQLILAYNMFMVGGNGLAAIAVATGHVTIFIRLGQLYFSIREAGWDRNRTGSAISEIANETSWIIVTIVWLIR